MKYYYKISFHKVIGDWFICSETQLTNKQITEKFIDEMCDKELAYEAVNDISGISEISESQFPCDEFGL